MVHSMWNERHKHLELIGADEVCFSEDFSNISPTNYDTTLLHTMSVC